MALTPDELRLEAALLFCLGRSTGSLPASAAARIEATKKARSPPRAPLQQPLSYVGRSTSIYPFHAYASRLSAICHAPRRGEATVSREDLERTLAGADRATGAAPGAPRRSKVPLARSARRFLGAGPDPRFRCTPLGLAGCSIQYTAPRGGRMPSLWWLRRDVGLYRVTHKDTDGRSWKATAARLAWGNGDASRDVVLRSDLQEVARTSVPASQMEPSPGVAAGRRSANASRWG